MSPVIANYILGLLEKYCYDDLTSNCDIYGGFYQWAEAVQYLNGATNTTSWNPSPTGNVQGICPAGWHIPADAEWTQMTDFLGGSLVAGGKMKETGTTHWLDPNGDATNSIGFTILGSGHREPNGTFTDIHGYSNYWSSTEYSATFPWSRALGFLDGIIWTDSQWEKTKGFSVRCLKN